MTAPCRCSVISVNEAFALREMPGLALRTIPGNGMRMQASKIDHPLENTPHAKPFVLAKITQCPILLVPC